jgi:hypothetical protein
MRVGNYGKIEEWGVKFCKIGGEVKNINDSFVKAKFFL